MSISRDRKIAESSAFALFEACCARKISLKSIYEGVSLIRALCQAEPAFYAFLKSPLFDADEKHSILKILRLPAALTEYLQLIIANHTIPLLTLMIEHFSVLYYKYIKESQGVIVVAREETLTPAFKNQIKAKIEKTIGQKVDLSYEVNPDLYEGFTLEVGTYFMDASLKGTLSSFKRYVVGR